MVGLGLPLARSCLLGSNHYSFGMQEPINPYATPTTVNSAPLPQVSSYGVHDNKLIVEKYAELPELCYKTGEPVIDGVDGKTYRKNFNFCNPWLGLIILLGIIGIIVYLIVYFCVRKEVNVRYSLSKIARKKVLTKRLIGYSGCILILVASIYGISEGSASRGNEILMIWGFVGIALSLIGALITASVTNVIRVTSHVNGRFYLAGAGKGFLSKVQSLR